MSSIRLTPCPLSGQTSLDEQEHHLASLKKRPYLGSEPRFQLPPEAVLETP